MAGGYLVSLFTALLVVNSNGFVKISPYLHTCTKSSPNLNSCIKDSLSTLIRNLRNGSPELSIPALDPLIISQVENDYEDDGFKLIESFNNVFIFGLCDIHIETIKISLQQDKMEITSKIPKLSFQGHYKSEGQVINYPLASLGAFEVNLTDITSMWIIYFKRTSVNGTKYLQIEDFLAEMTPLVVNINVADSLDGDNTLEEDRLNEVLNESSTELFVHFKPKLMSTISQIFTRLANNVLLQYPEDAILPE